MYTIAEKHACFLRSIKSLENLDIFIARVIQPIRNLLGLTKTPVTFDDENFSESEYEKKYKDNPYIRIRTEVIDSKSVRIAIANTGSPIPVDIQKLIFEPFFTTKPVGRGTSLGLFVSYSIIREHGGTLNMRSLQSSPGEISQLEGTEFEIVLPQECGYQ